MKGINKNFKLVYLLAMLFTLVLGGGLYLFYYIGWWFTIISLTAMSFLVFSREVYRRLSQFTD